MSREKVDLPILNSFGKQTVFMKGSASAEELKDYKKEEFKNMKNAKMA